MSNRLLTEADFEYFKSRCYYWLRELGQARWRTSFAFQKFRGKMKNANAFVWTTSDETFLVKFFLNKNYWVEPGFGRELEWTGLKRIRRAVTTLRSCVCRISMAVPAIFRLTPFSGMS